MESYPGSSSLSPTGTSTINMAITPVSPTSSISKYDYSHAEHETKHKDHAKPALTTSDSDYAHFRPQENQTAPKFIQLEQGALNAPPALGRPKNFMVNLKSKWYIREGLAEFFGTMVMIIFGVGSVAQVVLAKGTKGDYQSISWGWGKYQGLASVSTSSFLQASESCSAYTSQEVCLEVI